MANNDPRNPGQGQQDRQPQRSDDDTRHAKDDRQRQPQQQPGRDDDMSKKTPGRDS